VLLSALASVTLIVAGLPTMQLELDAWLAILPLAFFEKGVLHVNKVNCDMPCAKRVGKLGLSIYSRDIVNWVANCYPLVLVTRLVKHWRMYTEDY